MPRKNDAITLRINRRELATILAALRFWQQHGPNQPNSFFDRLECDEQDLLDEIRTNSSLLEPLRLPEISQLCERLNTGEGQQALSGLVIDPPDKGDGNEPLFRAVYAIDVNAVGPCEAAQQAYRIMADPESHPPVIEILDHKGKVVSIDLSEDKSA